MVKPGDSYKVQNDSSVVDQENLFKNSGQQGYAPIARYAGQNHDQHEYKNRYDNYHFIFHDGSSPENYRAKVERSRLAANILFGVCGIFYQCSREKPKAIARGRGAG